jgi:hypothetical protein
MNAVGKLSVVAGLLVLAAIVPVAAHSYGADGHRIAGMIAQARLCEAARREVGAVGGGESLAELGLWADRIRSQQRWAHTGPWHYMNIPDDTAIGNYVTPPERDILWAIADSQGVLANRRLPLRDRRDALRFLTHFIVDLHQPLHVGRAEDRGGNRIDVRLGRRTLNLHRFWDTEAITLAGLTTEQYVARAGRLADTHRDAWFAGTPRDWAAESQALRGTVYAFGRSGDTLSDRYIDAALQVTETRLAQAGARLAMTLNDLWCN